MDPRIRRRKLVWKVWWALLLIGSIAIGVFNDDSTSTPAFILNWLMLCVVVLLPLHGVRILADKLFDSGKPRRAWTILGAVLAFVVLGLAALEFMPTF